MWIEGQFTSAASALRVLESRAKASATVQSNTTASWPEFSEYDCFACHHALNSPSWRQSLSASAQHHSGVPKWGSWHYDGVQALDNSALLPETERGRLMASLRNIGDPLQSLITGKRNAISGGSSNLAARPQTIANQVPEALASLDACIKALLATQELKSASAISPQLRNNILKSLWDHFEQSPPTSWDEFVQYYLALVAIDRSEAASATKNGSTRVSGTASASVLNEIRNKLSFPEAVASPSTPIVQPGDSLATSSLLRVLRPGINSPADFDRKADGLSALLRRAFQQLSTTSSPP
jgi:hypothetical protein